MIAINRLLGMAPTDGGLRAVWFTGFTVGLLGLDRSKNPFDNTAAVELSGDVNEIALYDVWNAGHEVGLRERMRAYATLDADIEPSVETGT